MAGDSTGVAASQASAERLQPPSRAEAPKRLDFDSLYDETFAFVWRTARRMGVEPSALDDVCQEVFVIVHRRLGEFEGRSSVRTWVFGIVSNVVLVHRRSLSRRSPAHRPGAGVIDPDVLVDDGPGPHETASLSELAAVARALLAELDDDKRTVFILVELEQMPVTEVSEALGVNVNTVYARLRAAREAFSAAAKRRRARQSWRSE